jgi:hypothetical protein
MNIDEIRKFATDIQQFHSTRIKEQELDQQFYDDVFPVDIIEPFHVTRTGTGARIVDAVVDHIELATPQVFREPRKNTDGARKSALKISKFLNHLIKAWMPEIEELYKNGAGPGDFIGLVQYNDKYRNDLENGIPILFDAPNPMNMFCYPSYALVPSQVVKKVTMKSMAIRELAPEWNGDVNTDGNVEYLAYWDNNTRYIEAGNSPLYPTKNNDYPNYLGFVPIVHGHSGFGKRSSDGDPASMAVGLLRRIRNTLTAECETQSRIDSIIALYANPIFIYQAPADGQDHSGECKALEEAIIGPGQNLNLPPGFTYELYVPNVGASQLFEYLYQLKSQIQLYNPPIMQGVTDSGSTGRLADIQYEHIAKKPSKLVRNVERALAEALGMALRILERTPQALPVTVMATEIKDGKEYKTEETITKEDIDGYYDCTVTLNPDKELENDRLIMLGRILVNEGRVSWKYFLTHYMHKTEDEADDMMAEAIAEIAVKTSPMLSQVRDMKALEQIGAADMAKKLQLEQQGNMKAQQTVQESGYRPSEATQPGSMDALRQVLQATPTGVRESANA